MCYRCEKWTEAGKGHFERYQGKWRVHCVECALMNKGVLPPGIYGRGVLSIIDNLQVTND